jgi:peptidoglycan hydrolase-like protein with peptidoglycan-binding domain
MKWLAIIASVALGGVSPSVARASSARSQQGSSPAAASPSVAPPSTPKKASTKKKHHYARREPKQKAPTPERISEIQSALARNGYYQGDPNGKWDSNTVGAMQKFQSDHGLDATGKLDALSLQKLGLGSDIAGVSAPRPVTPASSSSTPTQTNPASAKPQQQAKVQ